MVVLIDIINILSIKYQKSVNMVKNKNIGQSLPLTSLSLISSLYAAVSVGFLYVNYHCVPVYFIL